MSLLNYLFIGTAFTFLCDILMGLNKIKNHPKIKDNKWGWNERITCVLFWPICFIIFSMAFIKQLFK